MAGLILAHPNHASGDGIREFPLGDEAHPLSWNQRERGLDGQDRTLALCRDNFDLVRRAAFGVAFPITGTGVLLLDDRRSNECLLRGGLRLGVPLRWLLVEWQ